MGSFENKRILIVDRKLPHIHDICTMLRKCDSSFILDITHDVSFNTVKSENYDAVFVCIGILEDCEERVIEFAKFNPLKKTLKVFILFEKVPSVRLLNNAYKEKGFDGVLSLPFDYDDLKEKLG